MLRDKLPSGGTVTYLERTDWGANGGATVLSGRDVADHAFIGMAAHYTPALGLLFDEASERPRNVDDLDGVRGFTKNRLQPARPDLSRDRNNPEVPYSGAIIMGHDPLSAVACEGRGRGRSGAHTPGHNSTRYGVAFIIDPDTKPTVGMIEAFNWLAVMWLTNPAGAKSTILHSDVTATSCPGDHVRAIRAQLEPSQWGGKGTGGSVITTPTKVTPNTPGKLVGVGDLILAGDYGIGVEVYQRRINDLLQGLKTSARMSVTGVHDTQSVNWTKAFQSWANIGIDGKVGTVETWPALTASLANTGEAWAKTYAGTRQ